MLEPGLGLLLYVAFLSGAYRVSAAALRFWSVIAGNRPRVHFRVSVRLPKGRIGS